MSTPDPRLVADVKLAEALDGVANLTAYRDSRGNWTIGFGHLMENQSDTAAGVTITGMRAIELLEEDIDNATTQAKQTSEWPHLDTACRQNAVIELIFNMGEHKWLGFVHCRAAMRVGNWQEAFNQLLDSAWTNEVGPHRSQRLANYLLTGVYP